MVSWRSWSRLVFGALLVVVACSGKSEDSGTGGTTSSAGKKSGGTAGKAGKAGIGPKGGSSGTGGSGDTGGSGGTSDTGGTAGKGGRRGMPMPGKGGDVATAGEAGETTSATGGSGGTGRGGIGNIAGSSNGGTAGVAFGGRAGSGSVVVPSGWSCTYAAYGDGTCDCGCGARDSDCADDDIGHCERCNASQSCSYQACPGRIDEKDVTSCVVPPSGWTCGAFYYDDGNCDCGCGVVDIDCADDKATSCDNCRAAGSCAGGSCPGPIDPQNNAACITPPGWTCPLYLYADGSSCDCGCGITDPDCASQNRSSCNSCWYGCSDESCPGPIDANNNAICTGVPAAWSCPARFYHDGAICNCGCGAPDPDCADNTVASCDSCDFTGSCSKRACPGTINPTSNAFCAQPPPPSGWTCSSYRYADGYNCDCGCGVVDLDCPEGDDVKNCNSCDACSSACPGLVNPSDISACIAVPTDWSCSTYLYNDGFCDCGCGVRDPDCADGLQTSCQRCSTYSGSCALNNDCSTTILPNDNASCTNSAPAGWTCPRKYYGDQACDCGCGVKDSDCANATSAVCKFCDDTGSCSTLKCANASSTINPTDNSQCTQ